MVRKYMAKRPLAGRKANSRVSKPVSQRSKSLNKENVTALQREANGGPESQPRKKARTATSKTFDDAQEAAMIGWIRRVKEMSYIPNVLQLKSTANYSNQVPAKLQWIISWKVCPRI